MYKCIPLLKFHECSYKEIKQRGIMQSFLILLALMISSLVHAQGESAMGAGSSGGGMVVVCNHPSVGHTRIELLDVYEARKNKAIKVVESTNDLNQDFIRMNRNKSLLQGKGGTETNAYFENQLNGILTKLIDWHYGPDPLEFTNDQGQMLKLPVGCSLVQAAIFHDKPHKMVVDFNIWNQLDSLSQAALLIHEEFYFYQRQLGIKDSASARNLVGQVLASKGAVSAWKGQEKFNYKCFARNHALPRTGTTDFLLNMTKKENGFVELNLQFVSLLGQDLLTLTLATFKGLPLNFSNIMYGLETNTDYQETATTSELKSTFLKGISIDFLTFPGKSSKLIVREKNKSPVELEIKGCLEN